MERLNGQCNNLSQDPGGGLGGGYVYDRSGRVGSGRLLLVSRQDVKHAGRMPKRCSS